MILAGAALAEWVERRCPWLRCRPSDAFRGGLYSFMIIAEPEHAARRPLPYLHYLSYHEVDGLVQLETCYYLMTSVDVRRWALGDPACLEELVLVLRQHRLKHHA